MDIHHDGNVVLIEVTAPCMRPDVSHPKIRQRRDGVASVEREVA